MKRRLIIHGGMHKTGSSAIQTLLDQNSSLLLESGLLYPKAGTFYHPGIGRRHFYVRETLFATHEKNSGYLHELWQEIEASNSHTVILSYENFLSPGIMSAEVISWLKDRFDVSFVCYFRNPISYFDSKYREWLRRLNFKGDSGDFALSHLGYLDWRKMLLPWVEAFGRENIYCRAFSKDNLLEGRVEKDFLSVVGDIAGCSLAGVGGGSVEVNPSHNNDQALASLIRNQYFGGHKSLTPEQRSSYGRFLRELGQNPCSGLILSRQTVQELSAGSKRSVSYLDNEMGVKVALPKFSELSFDDTFYCCAKRQTLRESMEKRLTSGRPKWVQFWSTGKRLIGVES